MFPAQPLARWVWRKSWGRGRGGERKREGEGEGEAMSGKGAWLEVERVRRPPP